jgi:uncharacterized protein YndB with AHSA1/START domain
VQKGGTQGVFFLEDLGEQGTRLRIVSTGWHQHQGEEWERAFDYFLKNNPRYMKSLHDKLAVFNRAAGGDRILNWTAEVDGPVAEVWKAFTTKEGIESWMVPVVEVDLRRGGSIRTNYNPKAKIGDPGTITHVILAYEPERMISSRFIAPENAPAAKVAEATWGVSFFEEIAPQRTRVTYRSCGWGHGPEWDTAERFFEQGNAWTFDRLRAKFAAISSAE